MLPINPTLSQIQRMFFDLYAKRNARLYGSPNILLHIFEEASVLAELFRKEEQNLSVAMARLFAWLLAFCNNEGIQLDQAVFHKYHGACPYCGRAKHCLCISSETKTPVWKRGKIENMPQSLPEWQNMFADIYGRVNKIAGREKCWLHVLEELGEVSAAFRLKRPEYLRDELADVFAWLCAFCNGSKINLESALLGLYPGQCNACGQRKCKCPIV